MSRALWETWRCIAWQSDGRGLDSRYDLCTRRKWATTFKLRPIGSVLVTSEAICISVNQGILSISQNTNACRCVHTGLTLIPVLRRKKPLEFSLKDFNITSQTHHVPSYCTTEPAYSFPVHIPFSVNYIFFDFFMLMLFTEELTLRISQLCSLPRLTLLFSS
jgi:hypothetical protein